MTLSVSLFTSCSDDDEPYVPQLVNVSNGAFVINAGNSSSSISGSVTYFDYTSYTATQNVFKSANGRELGITANDAVIYGSKMYIVVTSENTVEVVDKSTMVSLGTVNTDQALGTDNGTQPRHAVAYEGKVYVSTFAGYVAEIDTTSYSVTNTYQVGSYPEGMAVSNGVLYVANSDYGYGNNPSISMIDLSSGNITTLTDELIMNPVSFAVIDGEVYYLDYGQYDASWNQTDAGVRRISGTTVTKVADATMMASYGTKLYLCNAPYSYPSTTPTYSIYDVANDTSTAFTPSNIYSPCAMGVDPVTGELFIASYQENTETGYAGYSIDGYVNVYSNDGSTSLRSFSTGVGPTAIIFNTGVAYE
ncbi:MAG: hypothetical protein Q4D41_03480 [Prevotellaceae bacterium]|nr:hypothetical protein [Prevotellaceae bacterium]